MRKETISVAVYSAHGNPADVLRIETQPWPRPGADEVVVAMQAAPINPADLNAIEGKYPGKREVPAVPGFEGSGIISEVGRNISNGSVGSLVILPHAEKAAALSEPTDINPFCPATDQPNQTGIARIVVAVNPRR